MAVSTIKKETQTFCVGRHLIDLPMGFEPVVQVTALFKQPGLTKNGAPMSVAIRAAGITRPLFSAMVTKRKAEIVAFGDDTTDILKEAKALGEDATMFRILRIKEAYTSELHVLKGDTYLTIEANSYHARFLEAEEHLNAFVADIVIAASPSIPQRGFCLGPVVAKGLYDKESANFSFRNKERPDIVISIGVNTYVRDESETLLQRVSGPDSLLKKFDARNKVLREGELKVAGMRAQEWLSWVKLGEHRDKKQFGFALETMRPAPGPDYPLIHIELDTGESDLNGVRHVNSLTDEEAIALWDSIVKSIRLRQPAIE
jgi:hypothetical protein